MIAFFYGHLFPAGPMNVLPSLRTLNLMVRGRSWNRLTSIFRDPYQSMSISSGYLFFSVHLLNAPAFFRTKTVHEKNISPLISPGIFFNFPNYFPEKYPAGTNSFQGNRSSKHHRDNPRFYPAALSPSCENTHKSRLFSKNNPK